MKKSRTLILALALMMLTGGAGAAGLNRGDYSIASGTVTAAAWEDITAPWTGILLPFDWEAGDRVTEGEGLFQVRTDTIRAAEDGTVAAVFAEAGNDAASVISRYTSLAAIEPEDDFRIEASTSGAYNRTKNRELHVGETLYFRSTIGDRVDGWGQVIAITGDNYLVDIQSGRFSTKDVLSLFRSDAYNAQDKVGTGTVVRRDPMTVTAYGRVEEVLIKEGDHVSAEDPLFVMLPADTDNGAGSLVSSPCDGVFAAVSVMSGQTVWKGALLARIYRTDQYEVVAEVDEMDLSKLRIGTSCPIVLDMDENTVLTGTVTEISGVGFTKQNAAYFQVHFAVEGRQELAIGASASVYLPK